MPLLALTRDVSDRLAECELTHLDRMPIDVGRARAQHAAYEAALQALGCTVRHIPPAMDLPDSVFVEDTAVVFDEIAVVTRPGASSRRAETPAVAEALAQHRPVTLMTEPATLDGGDVLCVGSQVFVGVGGRSNEAGVRQLREALEPWGYTVAAVPVGACLHLKSGVTAIDDRTLLINPDWVDPVPFSGFACVEVDPSEPFAANVLRVGDTLVCAAAAGRTRARLESRGCAVIAVDVSELAKAEAGVTCCSLIVRV